MTAAFTHSIILEKLNFLIRKSSDANSVEAMQDVELRTPPMTPASTTVPTQALEVLEWHPGAAVVSCIVREAESATRSDEAIDALI